jgi:hypothetical protein
MFMLCQASSRAAAGRAARRPRSVGPRHRSPCRRAAPRARMDPAGLRGAPRGQREVPGPARTRAAEFHRSPSRLAGQSAGRARGGPLRATKESRHPKGASARGGHAPQGVAVSASRSNSPASRTCRGAPERCSRRGPVHAFSAVTDTTTVDRAGNPIAFARFLVERRPGKGPRTGRRTIRGAAKTDVPRRSAQLGGCRFWQPRPRRLACRPTGRARPIVDRCDFGLVGHAGGASGTWFRGAWCGFTGSRPPT